MPLTNSNCLFVHIPKCGGTSIEVALGVADEYPELGLKPTFTTPSIPSLFGGDLQHLTIREIIRNHPTALSHPQLFLFSVLRNPIDRFISYISWKHFRFWCNPPSNDDLRRELSIELDTLFTLSRALEVFRYPFDGLEYCEGIEQSINIHDVVRHIVPQCCYIFCEGEIKIHYLYSTMSIPALEMELRQRGHLKHPISRRMVGGFASRILSALTPSELAELAVVYRFDFHVLNLIYGINHNFASMWCRSAELKIDSIGISSLKKQRNTINRGVSSELVPREIWMYWHTGWKNLPLIVFNCVSTWIIQNSDWRIHLLSADNISEFIEVPEYLSDMNLPFPALSDIIRINLLANYGGVWADATTWCVRPLSDWIDNVVNRNGFFAYSNPAPDRPLSSWFLASTANNYIARVWKIATDNFWQERRTKLASASITDDPISDNYFWFHNLFRELLETDLRFSELWARRYDISADLPHYLQQAGLLAPSNDTVLAHILNKMTNVYKLNRRIALPEKIAGTVLSALFETVMGTASDGGGGRETVVDFTVVGPTAHAQTPQDFIRVPLRTIIADRPKSLGRKS